MSQDRSTSRGSSTMVRRQLGRRLRALREDCGKTRQDVVSTRIMSHGKLEMIEYGRTAVRPGDVYELCTLYGATPEVTEALRELAVASTQEGWWQEHGGITDKTFQTFVDLETAASSIFIVHQLLVPGLLQTEDYARAVERASNLERTDEAVERAVRLRLHRQEVLFSRADQVDVHIVLGEGALRLAVGDATLMKDQIAHMLDVSRRQLAEIRVLPFAAGPHAGLLGDFTLMDFLDPEDPSIAYIASYVVSRYYDRPIHVDRHRRVYSSLHTQSVSLEEYTS